MNDFNTATERVRDTVDDATESAHSALDSAAATARHLSASSQQLAEDVNAYVSAHPLQSLAFALAAGFVIGRMMR